MFSIIQDVTERKSLQWQVLEISEQERRRVGRDLHDSLGGKLAGTALLAKALSQSLAAKGLSETQLADEVAQCVNEAISQTRAIAQGLCPVVLSEFGLLAGLQEYASDVEKIFGVTCRVMGSADVDLRGEFISSHLLRIVQEAVNNAIRHGKASNIRIALAQSDGRVCLEIQDDGCGLPNSTEALTGMGLRTMRYRADVIGAKFEVRNIAGKGTLVTCLLPLEQNPNHLTSSAYANHEKSDSG